MILVDTSVWIDHLRKPESSLVRLLGAEQVTTHPLVRLELALGSIANRRKVLMELAMLPHAPIASTSELFRLVEVHRLERLGIGVTDLHLIASTLLDRSISLWTRDRCLGEIAERLGLRAAIA